MTIKKWLYEDEMSFILPHYRERQTISSVTDSSNAEDDDTDLNFIFPNDDSQNSTNANQNLTLPEVRPESSASSVPPTPAIRAKKGVAEKNSTSGVLLEYTMNENKENEDDEIDKFFMSIAATVKKLSGYNQAIIKTKIFSTVSEMEFREIADMQVSNNSFQCFIKRLCTNF